MTLSREGIGASQAAAAVGLHPFCHPLELWRELVGEAPPFEGNEATRWGLLLEPAVRQAYADEVGVEVEVPSESTFHPEHPWRRASPDGIARRGAERWGVEIKTSSQYLASEWGPAGGDEVPLHYATQCAWSMHVLDLDRWDLAALIGGRDFRVYHLHRDRSFEEELVETVSAFWDLVQSRTPPEIDGSTAWSEYLARRHAFARDEYRKADVEAERDAEALKRIRRTIDELEQRQGLLENRLKEAIGEAAGIETKLGRITWKPSKGRTTTDWQAIARQLADKFEVAIEPWMRIHTKTSEPTRRFLVPRSWSKEA